MVKYCEFDSWQHCKKQVTMNPESDFYDPQLPLAGQKRYFHEIFAKNAQCGNVGNLPPLQKIFVKSIYSVTLQ